jgi:pyridoxine kinase
MKKFRRRGENMKRVLTIQDISCLGKCSLTIALPVISALGSETVILPTAVLSTHTMFKNFTCKDLSDQIEPITRHWKAEGVTFDAIYTGYLGTVEQIEPVKDIIRAFRTPDTLVFIDPVMADNGKLYPAFDMAYVERNKTLCGMADIIVPNITEAALMTGMEYREEYDEEYIKEMLARLNGLGAKISVLTGVSRESGMTGVMGYDSTVGRYFTYQRKRIDAAYHGTGDLFSSTCVGELLNGKSWQEAMRIAAEYTAITIDVTMKNPKKPWYGVDFESTIPQLISMK